MSAKSMRLSFYERLRLRMARLWLPLFDKRLSSPTRREAELVEELRETCRRIPVIDTQGLPPSQAAWEAYSNTVRQLILDVDPREFLRWPVIHDMMFDANQGFIFHELSYLKRLPGWNARWRKSLIQSPIGRPIPNELYPPSSGNLIHQAYHVARFEEKSGVPINEMNYVFEVGGGYGNMCRLFYNLGFRGKYLMLDLPVFSALQQFYLKSTGLAVHSVDSFKAEKEGVVCISEQGRLADALSEVGEKGHRALFVAAESLSEILIPAREFLLALVGSFDAFLINYSHRFREIDNVTFFQNWKQRFGGEIVWHEWQEENTPNISYLVGTRR